MFCTKKEIFFQTCPAKLTDNANINNENAEHFTHFHSRSKCISAIIIEIKTGDTLKCMLCFFRSNLSLLAKMVIGKTIFLLLELTEKN